MSIEITVSCGDMTAAEGHVRLEVSEHGPRMWSSNGKGEERTSCLYFFESKDEARDFFRACWEAVQ